MYLEILLLVVRQVLDKNIGRVYDDIIILYCRNVKMLLKIF